MCIVPTSPARWSALSRMSAAHPCLEMKPASIFVAQIAKFEGNALRRLYEITVNLAAVSTIA
jgi:hypothetical protein